MSKLEFLFYIKRRIVHGDYEYTCLAHLGLMRSSMYHQEEKLVFLKYRKEMLLTMRKMHAPYLTIKSSIKSPNCSWQDVHNKRIILLERTIQIEILTQLTKMIKKGNAALVYKSLTETLLKHFTNKEAHDLVKWMNTMTSNSSYADWLTVNLYPVDLNSVRQGSIAWMNWMIKELEKP